MDFRTIIPLSRSEKAIDYNAEIVLFGSCFTENIGRKLISNKFRAEINPFGIIYNPLSVENAIKRLLNKELIKEEELFFHENAWHSFDYHSSFSSKEKDVALQKMNERILLAADKLRQADWLLITFGTAWVYEEKESGKIVSNCHKIPEKNFRRKRISLDETATIYSNLLTQLQTVNPKLQILFTVSPIRHWKDGAHENSLSKATLLLLIDRLKNQFDFVRYFPAYELVIDDLRDYRFYAEDMLHPNQTAIDYIWERFGECYFSKATMQAIAEITRINRAFLHRPFNAQTESYKIFCQQQLNLIEVLKTRYPAIDFSQEENFFKHPL